MLFIRKIYEERKMVSWFDIGISIAEEVVTLLFISMYLGWKYDGRKRVIGFIAVLFVSVTTMECLNSLYVYEGFLGMIFTVIYFSYSVICLKGDLYTKLFISQFANCVAYFIAIISILAFSALTNIPSEMIYTTGSARIWLSILSKVVLILVFSVLLKFKTKSMKHNTYMKILVFLPAVTGAAMTGIMNMFLAEGGMNNNLLLSTISIMMANVLIFYAFIKISIDMKEEAEMRIMRQKYENDKHFAEEIEELYLKTCGLRHDILNHMRIVSELIEKDRDKALEYVNSVTNNQLGEMKHIIKTDNVCFDAIVNAKLAVCEKLQIKLDVMVMNGSLSRIQNDEIGVIFGNLFDNAIEAASDAEEKRIELDIRKQGKRCSIVMTNGTREPVLKTNSGLNTTKKDGEYHGFGLKNIRRVVDNYGGMINFYEEYGLFICDILI